MTSEERRQNTSQRLQALFGSAIWLNREACPHRQMERVESRVVRVKVKN